jgi:hypothetical protein
MAGMVLPGLLHFYNFHAFANVLKLLSYVFSTSGGKQQPGNCLADKW